MLLLRNGGAGGRSFASVVDAHSGREVERTELPGGGFSRVLHVHRQHLADINAEQSVYLLLSAAEGAPSVTLLPDTPLTR